MNLQINNQLVIPKNEIHWRFSRSAGPGGQNVNKTESRVEIIFHINNSKVLSPFQKYILLRQLNKQINHGSISIIVQEKRTQYENRQLAMLKLTSLLRDNLNLQTKARKKTIPSKNSQIKRLEAKKKRGILKKNRQYKLDKDL